MSVTETSKEVLKNSRFSHLFEKDGVYCLQHNLTLRKVYGGQILKVIYENFNQPQCVDDSVDHLGENYPADSLNYAISDLKEKGLLVADNRDDLRSYVELFERGMQQNEIQHMYFIPTVECNFRCRYCFVEDDDRSLSPTYMTRETAKKGLETFAKLSENAKRISITFYGGEPLLNADVVYAAMRYVRELESRGLFKQTVAMSLLTNGVYVDDNTVGAALETKTKVSISIDGPARLHDSTRLDIGGGATFDRALAGYRKLQAAGVDPGISCTLNRFNLEHIEEIARFIAEELSPSGMGFNILLPRLNAGNPVDVSHEYAASQLISAFKTLREHGIYEDRVMRRVRPYSETKFHLKDCMGVGGQIVLTPDGKVGPCQAFLGLDEYFPLDIEEMHSQLASIMSEHIYSDQLFDEWLHRFPINMNECADCFAIAICGGGCPYASHVNHGSIWSLDERICSQSKQIMEWMIWDTYDHLLDSQEGL